MINRDVDIPIKLKIILSNKEMKYFGILYLKRILINVLNRNIK